MENPPVVIRDGGVINDGLQSKSSTSCGISPTARPPAWLVLKSGKRLLTGISTLKVGYNKVHGFYIEVSRANSHLVPAHYIRRQTLKNNERYIIDQLKKYEDQGADGPGSGACTGESASMKSCSMPAAAPSRPSLQESAAALSELDVLANLAERAETLNYCCPELVNDEDQHRD